MKIIDHGEWEIYKPSEHPSGVPQNAIFMRRKSDHVDWYDYIYGKREKPAPKLDPVTLLPVKSDYTTQPILTQNFGADTVKFAVMWRKEFNAFIVGAASRDVTMIVPFGQTVYEITDYVGDDPFAEFSGKAYDHAAGTFAKAALVDFVKPPFLVKVDELSDRLTKLEKEVTALKRGGNKRRL
jgi:hypothetical protein